MNTIFLTLISLSFVATGLCIDCYRCNSTNVDCSEKFFNPSPLKSESCADVFEARYCVKTIGMYKGVVGSQRFCSPKDLGNYCEILTYGDNKQQVRSCVYTCAYDGCNAGPSNRPTALFVSALLAVAFLFHRKICWA